MGDISWYQNTSSRVLHNSSWIVGIRGNSIPNYSDSIYRIRITSIAPIAN